MLIASYASLHFLVDMICAWAMFSRFLETGYESLLVYNFCAFALQMPIGTLVDLFRSHHRKLPVVCAAAGTVLTLLGAFVHPLVLGTGNALFHVGGGVDVMEDDVTNNRRGALLGVFVAPGAMGLYLGMVFGKSQSGLLLPIVAALLLIPLLSVCFGNTGVNPRSEQCFPQFVSVLPVMLCCFAVVILRSWVGLDVRFDWQSTAAFSVLAVLATALGKACGGLMAARFGIVRTAVLSLIFAAMCYQWAQIPVFGLFAFFFFNMSMPLTLYLLAKNLPGMAGFSFGMLTFGIFLGFLPVYLRMDIPVSGNLAGMLCSVFSCLLLIAAGKAGCDGKVSA